MEIDVEELLDGMIRANQTDLTPDDQTLLAAWMSKCALAYSGDDPLDSRPWTDEEYDDLRTTKQPALRARIWVGRSEDLSADISLSVSPLFISRADIPASELPQTPPGAVSVYLAAHSVIFFGQWWPIEMAQLPDGGPAEHLTAQETRNMIRIWPNSSDATWPTGLVRSSDVDTMVNLFFEMGKESGVPMVGKTIEEIDRMRNSFLADKGSNLYGFHGRRRFSRGEDTRP